MVHGGFRYLQNGQIRLTFESVRERERLLKSARGLVTPLGFLLACYQNDALPPWVFKFGLTFYDLLALKGGHRYIDAARLRDLCPQLEEGGLRGGFRYVDAQTDDSRLVLRLIRQGVQADGAAINYARATDLLRTRDGMVCGIVLEDRAPGSSGRAIERTVEVQAKMVINATGAWADELRLQVNGRPRLRKLRGSHLILPFSRLPLNRAISFSHPRDGRFVFAFPWEGIILAGTTDVDHHPSLHLEPGISEDEAEYLMEGLQAVFPGQSLSLEDVQGSFSGIRPVIDTGKSDPSKESREHVIWCENRLLTIAGGKLTTFRLMARDALKAACAHGLILPAAHRRLSTRPILESAAAGFLEQRQAAPADRLRLVGRYGPDVISLAECANEEDYEHIGASPALWAEMRWAAHAEGIVHLEDLLLRRVRLGLILPQGGLSYIDRIRKTVESELDWDDSRWQTEITNYTQLWKRCYHLN